MDVLRLFFELALDLLAPGAEEGLLGVGLPPQIGLELRLRLLRQGVGVRGQELLDFRADLGPKVTGLADQAGGGNEGAGVIVTGGQVREGLAEVAVDDGEADRADPMMEGLPQFVDGEFFEGEGHERVRAGRNGAVTDRPPREALGFLRAGVTGARQQEEGVVDNGVAEAEQDGVLRRAEHGAAIAAEHEPLWIEDESGERAEIGVAGWEAQLGVHQLFPLWRQVAGEPIAAGVVRAVEAKGAGTHTQGNLEGGAEGFGVEVEFLDKLGQGLLLGIGLDFAGGDGVLGLTLLFGDVEVEHAVHGVGIAEFLEAALEGGIEEGADGAEVGADAFDLGKDFGEELEVGVVFAGEMEDVDVAGLAVAIETSVALVEAGGVPGDVEMEQEAGGLLEVLAFGGGVGGDENANGVVGIVEGLLDVLAVAFGEFAAAVEDAEAVFGFVGEVLAEAAKGISLWLCLEP